MGAVIPARYGHYLRNGYCLDFNKMNIFNEYLTLKERVYC